MKYNVDIVETLKKTVEVEADSPEEALDIVRDEHHNLQHVLTADDFFDVDFVCNPKDNKETEGNYSQLWMRLGVNLTIRLPKFAVKPLVLAMGI